MQEHVDRRRTDTRRRLRAIALELFTQQGYELTSLTQIAGRAGVTRQALLHHFASKEELLTESYEELLPALDELIDGASVSPGGLTHQQVVDRFDALARGEHGATLVCAHVTEHALRGLPAARTLQRKLTELTEVLATDDTPEGRMRGRLAVAAVVMAVVRPRELSGRRTQRHDAARAVARSLLGAEL
ncbi:AcrR family transcriptional regulator [Catenulispora sp. EB89]